MDTPQNSNGFDRTSVPDNQGVQGHRDPDGDAGDHSPQRTPNLALARTDLANERTLLAYVRTSLMLAATGISLIKFLNASFDFVLIGWGLLIAATGVATVGIKRFTSLKNRLDLVRREGS